MIILSSLKLFSDINQNIRHFIRKMSHNVFVYGTLKRNEPNHYWLTDPNNGLSKFVSDGKTSKKYPLVIATKYNIPFILHKPGLGHQIQGEVYEVDNEMLGNLDILEGHPNYYVRELDNVEIIKVNTNEIKTIRCWIYFLKSFKDDLLHRPMLDNYSSAGSHGLPYLERSKRDPNYDHNSAVKNDPHNNESTIDDLNDNDNVKVVK